MKYLEGNKAKVINEVPEKNKDSSIEEPNFYQPGMYQFENSVKEENKRNLNEENKGNLNFEKKSEEIDNNYEEFEKNSEILEEIERPEFLNKNIEIFTNSKNKIKNEKKEIKMEKIDNFEEKKIKNEKKESPYLIDKKDLKNRKIEKKDNKNEDFIEKKQNNKVIQENNLLSEKNYYSYSKTRVNKKNTNKNEDLSEFSFNEKFYDEKKNESKKKKEEKIIQEETKKRKKKQIISKSDVKEENLTKMKFNDNKNSEDFKNVESPAKKENLLLKNLNSEKENLKSEILKMGNILKKDNYNVKFFIN